MNDKRDRDWVEKIKIIYVLNTRADRALWDRIFMPIVAYNEEIEKNAQRASRGLTDHIGRLRPVDRRKALVVLSVMHYWRKGMELVMRPLNTRYPITASTQVTMFLCHPAGVINNIPADITCRRMAVCPSCRYRYGAGLISRLMSRLGEGHVLGRLSFHVPMVTDRGIFDSLELSKLKKTIRNICTKNRTWLCDVTSIVPTYALPIRQWVIAANIVALAKSEKDLPPQSTTGGLVTWEIHKATRRRLITMIAESVSYSPKILELPVKAPQSFVEMATFSGHLRCRSHGFRTQADREQRDDSEGQ